MAAFLGLPWALPSALLLLLAGGPSSDAVRSSGESDADNAFLKPSEVSREEVDKELEGEIDGEHSARRLDELQDAFLPLYTAMPKDSNGHLGHGFVRYSLHRLLTNRRGWFVKGLEPDRDVRNASNLTEWVPTYLMRHLESVRGVGLHEMAVLAATIEDLVRREAVGRLKAIFAIYDLSLNTTFNASFADDIIDTYALVYHKQEGSWDANSKADAWRRLHNFRRNYRSGWKRLSDFLRNIKKNVALARYPGEDWTQVTLDFEDLSQVAEGIGFGYSAYNNEMCHEMKQSLLNIEDTRPGRVLLSAFYRKAMAVRRWGFTEKIEYLRTLGALDESDPDRPRVIVANYIGSRPQCMEASRFYAICCISECEQLLSHLERAIAQPTATPARVAELVSALPSDTVEAPRELSQHLMGRLESVASLHGGQVPLYGRLFAQWMHHAFPRECPYPHEAGTTSPQSPDEWMKSTGQDITASYEEMGCHVDGNCVGGAAAVGAAAAAAEAAKEAGAAAPAPSPEEEIPWTDAEELEELAEL